MAEPSTTDGSTNGTIAAVRTADRPGKRNRASTHASGTPITAVNAVETIACATVTTTRRQVRPLERIRSSASRLQAPSIRNARPSTATTGTATATATAATATRPTGWSGRRRFIP